MNLVAGGAGDDYGSGVESDQQEPLIMESSLPPNPIRVTRPWPSRSKRRLVPSPRYLALV
jgi:hypothetical protein